MGLLLLLLLLRLLLLLLLLLLRCGLLRSGLFCFVGSHLFINLLYLLAGLLNVFQNIVPFGTFESHHHLQCVLLKNVWDMAALTPQLLACISTLLLDSLEMVGFPFCLLL